MASVDQYRELMRERFGYPDFRSGQARVLDQLSKSDVLAVMPTGSGKSLCYVLPALIAGRTLVVSPLIALMQDQVESLQAYGVRAAFINSNLDRSQQNECYQNFVKGELDLLYVAPERFVNETFVRGLRSHGINLLAIDEAHCVSEWGHDFRPEYLMLDSVRERLGSPRTLALTATADPRVRGDIMERLGIDGQTAVVVTSVDRPNLEFSVHHIPSASEREVWLLRYLQERKGKTGIVYARTRIQVEELAATLRAAGISAAGYHAGMSRDDRTRIQRQFSIDEIAVIVATVAFGMGIDKHDVRFVVHFNLPGRIESYYQEAGRAGRDGDPAECTLLYGTEDIQAQRVFIDRAHPDLGRVQATWQRLISACEGSEDGLSLPTSITWTEGDGFSMALSALRASGLVDAMGRRLTSLDPYASIDISCISEHQRYAQDRLRQMIEYAESASCRREIILSYFGEGAPPQCSACDNCLGESVPKGAMFPQGLYDSILTLREEVAQRAKRERVQIFELHTTRELATFRPRDRTELLQTWGIGEVRANWFGAQILEIIRHWEERNPDARERPERAAGKRELPTDIGEEVSEDDPLFQRLRDWRRSRAQQDGVPAFVVFSDRTLRQIAACRPENTGALLRISGIGIFKLARFGAEILEVVKEPKGSS